MSKIINSTVIPSSFRYRKVLEKGKPVHDKNDSFSIRHPAMDLSRRAKIFNPFDALKGFSDELSKAQEEVTDTFLDETGPIEETP
jgi:hypothetical protein